jgi:hypothetical protein
MFSHLRVQTNERSFLMKNFKLLTITCLIIGMVLAGCKSMQLDYLEKDTVDGPQQVRQGENISPSQITVWGVYKDGSRKLVNISASNIVFDRNTPGPQTVRVRVSNQEASFQTRVMALLSLTIASQPNTTIFKQGQEADRLWPGLEIQGDWDQMGKSRIAASSCEITGYNKDQTGRQSIRVSYLGKTVNFNVDVRAMTSIQIAQPPAKLDYVQGESLDLTSLRVNGVWEGLPAEELPVTTSNISGFSSENTGVQRLTITLNGRSANFDVDVWRLTGIMLDKPPNKTDYMLGESLDLTGIIVNGNYAGSTSAKRKTELIPINQLTVSGYNPNTIGRQQRVTVTVRGISANFFVNVGLSTQAPQDSLDGTMWMTTNATTTTTYTFNSPNVSYTSVNTSGNTMTRYGTYTVSGNTVTYIWTDDGSTSSATISGNSLTLANGVVLTRQ